jgi:hypothetical protein
LTRDLAPRALRWLRNRTDVRGFLRAQLFRAGPWWRDRRARRLYPQLDEAALRATRRSDTVFVFGCGSSVNAIRPAGWAHVAQHDVLGFSYFMRQRFVRADYHMVGEIATGDDADKARWEPAITEYATLLRDNPLYRDAVLLLQDGWVAYQSHRVLASGLLPPGTRVFRYRRIARGEMRPPNRSLADGLVLGAGTVVSVVNFAYALGWRRIVLCGIDLYDSRYFWLPPDEARPDMSELRGLTPDQPHPVGDKLVPYLAAWRPLLAAEGVELLVQNPRSLLASVLPVYEMPA